MLALPGDDANALLGYAVFLAENKRIGEALRLIDRALAVDPLNPLTYSWKAYIRRQLKPSDEWPSLLRAEVSPAGELAITSCFSAAIPKRLKR